jgi:hypothetical protein
MLGSEVVEASSGSAGSLIDIPGNIPIEGAAEQQRPRDGSSGTL